jgi:hypothetical protein
LESLLRSVTELTEQGLVQSATAEVRPQPASLFKLYIINGREAFQGFDALREHTVNIEEHTSSDFGPMSKDSPLFHQEATEDPEAVWVAVRNPSQHMVRLDLDQQQQRSHALNSSSRYPSGWVWLTLR